MSDRYDGLKICASMIDRAGVFASRAFAAGDLVFELNGTTVTIAGIEQVFIDGGGRISADGFQLSEAEYLVLDSFSNSINHSCDPNCGIVGSRRLIAVREIAAGEEITFDYSTAEWTPESYLRYDSTEWPMKCNCGYVACRRLITCFPYLSEELKAHYQFLGVLPDHVLQKRQRPREDTRCFVCERAIEKFKPAES